MKPLFAGALLFCAMLAAPCRADPAQAERQTQRALIERDRQAAEFARSELRDMPRRSDAEPLRPDERVLQAREREAYLLKQSPAPRAPRPAASAPSAPSRVERPLPLPGGAGHGVDPIPVQGPRG